MKTNTDTRHQTEWAAQFAVASELCKRGYEVSFTLGHNTPLADLMVVSPRDHSMFLVDVKGLAAKNYWQIRRQQPRSDLFYVVALVPRGAANEFFVLTQDQVNAGITAQFEQLRPDRKARGEAANRLGLRWGDAKSFADRWDTLPK
jgi:hypothetical protein